MSLSMDELIEQLRPNCETISKNSVGLFIKPKEDLAPALLVMMIKKLEKLGATYSATTNTLLLPQMPKKEQREPERLADILLTDLVPGPNPRLNIDNVGLQELYADMLKNGQKQRIEVRPSPLFIGKYEMIDGNRRKRVAEMLGWSTLRAVIKDMTDQEAYENAFIVNNDRQPLSSFEKGRWFKILMEKWPEEYPTQLSVAKKFGWHTSASVSKDIIFYNEEQARLDSLKPKPAPEPAAKEEKIEPAEQKTEQPTSEPESSFSENSSRDEKALNEPETTEQTPTAPPIVPQPPPTEEPEEHDESEKLPMPSPGHAAVIRNAPAKIQPLLRRAAAAGASVRQLEALKKRAQLPKFNLAEAEKNAQEKYRKEEKQEESKKRTVINSLKDNCPEQILQDITEHFDRVHFGTLTPAKLANIAFQLAQLELNYTNETWLTRHEEAKQNGQLKQFYNKIQEAL